MTQLISAYTRCPLCGSANFQLEPPGRRHCQDCGHRDFNNPITAVAALVLDAGENLLLIRRAKDPAKGKLAMPGGFVDVDETLEDAVRREISEEIGLTLNSVTYLTSHPNHYNYQGLVRPVCDVFFLVRPDSFDVNLEREEVIEWMLRPLLEIDPAELAFDSMRHALAVLKLQLR